MPQLPFQIILIPTRAAFMSLQAITRGGSTGWTRSCSRAYFSTLPASASTSPARCWAGRKYTSNCASAIHPRFLLCRGRRARRASEGLGASAVPSVQPRHAHEV